MIKLIVATVALTVTTVLACGPASADPTGLVPAPTPSPSEVPALVGGIPTCC